MAQYASEILEGLHKVRYFWCSVFMLAYEGKDRVRSAFLLSLHYKTGCSILVVLHSGSTLSSSSASSMVCHSSTCPPKLVIDFIISFHVFIAVLTVLILPQCSEFSRCPVICNLQASEHC